MYINGTSRASILIPLLVSYIVLRNLFPKQSKGTSIVVGAAFVIVLIITTIWKSFTRSGLEASMGLTETVEMLEQYFVGVSNMGKALLAKMSYGLSFRLDYFFNDLFTTVPYFSHFTNFDNTATARFNDVFGGRTDQIMPAIGNGLFYFGYLLSPLVIIIQIYFAMQLERMANKANTFPKYMVFTYGTVMLIYGCYSSIVIFVQKLVISFGLAGVITSLYDKIVRRKWILDLY